MGALALTLETFPSQRFLHNRQSEANVANRILSVRGLEGSRMIEPRSQMAPVRRIAPSGCCALRSSTTFRDYSIETTAKSNIYSTGQGSRAKDPDVSRKFIIPRGWRGGSQRHFWDTHNIKPCRKQCGSSCFQLPHLSLTSSRTSSGKVVMLSGSSAPSQVSTAPILRFRWITITVLPGLQNSR